MTKKLLTILSLILVTLLIIGGMTYSWYINRSFEVSKLQDAIRPDYSDGKRNVYDQKFKDNYTIISCKYDLLEPEVVNIGYAEGIKAYIAFYHKLKRNSIYEDKFLLNQPINLAESSEIHEMSLEKIIKEFKQNGCTAFKKKIDLIENVKIQGEGPVSIGYDKPISIVSRKALDDKIALDETTKLKNEEFNKLTVSQRAAHWKVETLKLYNGFLTATPDLLTPINIKNSKDILQILLQAQQSLISDPNFNQFDYEKEINELIKSQPELEKYKDLTDREIEAKILTF
jgi:hypothetical protein